MSMSSKVSATALMKELKSLTGKDPLEGVQVCCPDDSNIHKWEVAIFGPPETIYEGGYFKAELEFPSDYPMSPPSMKFLCDMWHPNVYTDGRICISILHPPGEDNQSGERPEERWNPTQSVRTILLSVISLLNEPNISSPANVDASVSYRKWRANEDDAYKRRVLQEVARSREDAKKDGVAVPTTLADYCIQAKPEAQDSIGAWSGDEDDFNFDDTDSDNDSIMSDDGDGPVDSGNE